MMVRAIHLLVLFVLTAVAWHFDEALAETVVQARSCSQPDVQTAIDSALDGDVVTVPAGSCTWTATVNITAGITLKGAGIGQTNIIDAAPTSTISLTTEAGKSYRVTGFAFRGGTVTKTQPEVIRLTGRTTAFRVDHNRFDNTALTSPQTRAIKTFGAVLGVIDHNEFIGSGGLRGAVDIEHPEWGGGDNANGDGSWADDSHWGTNRFVFIEDNVFTGPAEGNMFATDAYRGARFVFRYNRLTNANLPTHGSEAGGRGRGGRAYEIYNNVANQTKSFAVFFRLRSGTALIYGNRANGFGNFVALNNNRSAQNFGTWMSCDGSFPFDLNDGIVYDSGTHNGPAGATDLTDTTKTWQTDRWSSQGYSVRNVTKGQGGYALANTSTTIQVVPRVGGGTARFDPGDTYQILRARTCMDAPGSGKGALISAQDPQPKVWPDQVRDPVYVWDNVLNDGRDPAIAGSYRQNPHIVEGRDFFNGVPKPGYTPFVYPHPLVSGGAAPPAGPSAPTQLTVR